MSVLNDDKKVIEKGRKSPLKDVDASLRDQIVVKLAKKLKDADIGKKVSDLWDRGTANRVEWLEKQREFMASWDQHRITDPDGAFDGSSDLHVPMPLTVAKTMHARFFQAILSVDPPFSLKARTEAFYDRVPIVSDTMRYAINDWANYNKGIEEEIDKWLWSWITAGSGILKWGWDCRYTRFVDVVMEEDEAPPVEVIDPQTGRIVLQRKTKMVEKEKEITKKIFEGPTCSFRELEDIIIIGGGGNPDKADAVLECDWLDASQLWTLVDRKVFDADAVEATIESGPDSLDSQPHNAKKVDSALEAGVASNDNDMDNDKYMVIEAYLRIDVDGNGIFSDVVVWVHKKSRELLKATYLHRMNKAGERPYKKIDFHLRNGQEYGVGIVEMLFPLSKELDAMHNMRIDFGLISVMPFGFYRASSSINPETIHMEPGALIPVDNPQQDVYFPQMGNRSVFGFQEEQALQTMVERLTAISDMNLGVIGGQGITRTATGARTLAGESSANLDVYLRRLNRGWKGSLEYLLHMLQQRIPPGLSFRVTGESGNDYWRQIASQDNIVGDYDIEVSPNTSSSNHMIQEQNAQEIMQLTSNPLDIQLQIVTPANRYEALKNYMQAKGYKDFGRFIQKPQGYHRQFTPEEEANRLLRGIEVPVNPEDDHQGFIDFFDNIMEHDELLGQFDEAQTVALALQSRRHKRMMDALQQMAAQTANVQQMQLNAQQSQQQAPTGLSPLAGGQGAQAQPGPAGGPSGPQGQ